MTDRRETEEIINDAVETDARQIDAIQKETMTKATAGNQKRRWSFRGCLFFKMIALLLLICSVFLTIFCAGYTFYLFRDGFYDLEENGYRYEMIIRSGMQKQAQKDFEMMREYVYLGYRSRVEGYCLDSNLAVKIINSNNKSVYLDTTKDHEYGYEFVFTNIPASFYSYDYYLYVDADFPYQDAYWKIYHDFITDHGLDIYGFQNPYVYPAMTLVGLVCSFLLFLFLLCAAGHSNKRKQVEAVGLSRMYFDLFSVFAGCVVLLVAGIGIWVADELYLSNAFGVILTITIIGTIEAILCTYYLCVFATRVKLGKWWQHTLLYKLWQVVWKVCKGLFGLLVQLIKGIPMIPFTTIILGVICLFEFVGLLYFDADEMLVLWFLEKLVLIPAILYCALLCKKLLKGSEELAKGNLEEKIPTDKMFLAFKEHGENLNHIGEGMSRAVEERMKSERMKTELITNVSHDLKTPLTSIINYAELLGEEGLVEAQVKEYSEVLLRQSARLKRLLDNLIDASKAATGNLEVSLEKCEIGVMLTQAAAEYENRFMEKQLQLIVRQPDDSLYIMADGRHLWRVFDNLLSNICKYAQANSRVYITLEQISDKVQVIFRNISEFPLEMSGEELEERFVRGDKSRHMEGNGLGLSIAKSLTELQKGQMEIIIDGDLFKVILQFPLEVNPK